MLKERKIEFGNGGIVQPDENCSFYNELIMNFHYGQRYLKKYFGEGASFGWQIGAFGHSKAYLYISRLYGHKHIVLG